MHELEAPHGTPPAPAELGHALDMHALYDGAPCGLQVLDTHGRYRMINRTGLAWLGCEREDVLGVARPTDFYDTRGRSAFARNFARLLAGETLEGVELDLYGRNGTRRHVLLSASPVRSPRGEVVATQAVVHDVTDLRRTAQAEARRAATALVAMANAQLAALCRLRDALLRQLSHELRTPLHAILGFTELLQSGAVSPDRPEFSDFLSRIHAGGKQLLSLAEGSIDNTLGQDELLRWQAEPLDVLQEAHDTVDLLRGLAAARGVHVVVHGAHGLPAFPVDRLRFRQALTGYLHNAITHSPDGGRVDVRIEQRDRQLCVEVADLGPGIEHGRLARLFAPRGAPPRSVPPGSPPAVGLNLSLLRELVQQQGGRVSADSVPGAGSVFRFVLPSAG
jgi:PAS domain S-box-containing protein